MTQTFKFLVISNDKEVTLKYLYKKIFSCNNNENEIEMHENKKKKKT